MIKTALIVMAAGIGSRYGGLKQMEPVGPSGGMIIDYSIYDAIRAGFDEAVFVINENIEKAFKEKIGDHLSKNIAIKYACQRLDDVPPGFETNPDRLKPWGTAHAVYCCRNLIDGPFAVVNADDFYGAGAFCHVRDYLANVRVNAVTDGLERLDCCMAGYRIEDTLSDNGKVARGICGVDENGYLTEIVERTRIERMADGSAAYTEDGERYTAIASGTSVSMNMWGFPPGVMPEIGKSFSRFLSGLNGDEARVNSEFYLPTVVNELLFREEATVRVLSSGEKWYGLTYREDGVLIRDAISRMTSEGKYPERLW